MQNISMDELAHITISGTYRMSPDEKMTIRTPEGVQFIVPNVHLITLQSWIGLIEREEHIIMVTSDCDRIVALRRMKDRLTYTVNTNHTNVVTVEVPFDKICQALVTWVHTAILDNWNFAEGGLILEVQTSTHDCL